MPALWPTFIPALAADIAGQSFTKPGGAIVSYDLPRVGTDQVAIFPPSADLIKSIKPGNPLNSAIITNPASMINAINLAPLSGRYDFGVNVAERYLEAVKGLAMTPFGATHTNNPAAELILKQGYGLVFERMLKEGDIPMLDQKDGDGNITELGKESHPDYADFCPGPIEEPDPIEEQKKLDKKFSKFIKDHEDDSVVNLKKFKMFEFHCLDGTETQSDFIKLVTNRLLQQFETMSTTSEKISFARWASSLGNKYYKDLLPTSYNAGSGYSSVHPYPNVSSITRTKLDNANYNWRDVVNGISSQFETAILAAFSNYEDDINGANPDQSLIEDIINTGQVNDIIRPWPSSKGQEPECPLSTRKIQISYNRETDSKRPAVLSDQVVVMFSYDNSSSVVKSFNNLLLKTVYWYKKDEAYIQTKYVNEEYKVGWNKIPNAINSARTTADIIAMAPTSGGTVFKFQRQQVVDAVSAAEECDANEADPEINFSWPGGDPYLEMAQITIAYWYACLIKPFAPSPSALPALIPPPLTGIYIPIYYGGAKRLAGNLRKAWNTGKTFSIIPAPQPPALAVSAAVAAAYALHLLEFKLLYLGGIPTPAGPIPMIGIVPIVF